MPAVKSQRESTFAELREAQTHWAAVPVKERLNIIRALRDQIARHAGELARAVGHDHAETLAGEVLPLASGCRFLERNAERLLRPQKPRLRERPLWLPGVSLEIRREPFGVVLVIGPANYPLFLPAVHAVQALIAGNAVVIKPGVGGLRCMELFGQCLQRSGLDPRLCAVLGESTAEVSAALEYGIDKVVFTGSSETGRTVMPELARRGIPSVMELSGHDPVFVREDADLNLVVRALRFGTTFNRGQTCIAPKTLYASPDRAHELIARLQREQIDLPVIAADDDEALEHASRSGYALGASIFGAPAEAQSFAGRIQAGVVVINDMIAPTADPRVPFGGRRKSGFGVTRGADGLLEMTQVKAVLTRRSSILLHLDGVQASDANLFEAFIGVCHRSSIGAKFRALQMLLRSALQRGKQT